MPQSIAAKELLNLHQQGKSITLIDVRTPAEFREQHITFAKNLPLDKLDAEALRSQVNVIDNEGLYMICQGGKRSEMACEKLSKMGISNTISVEGGTLACVAAGLPIVKGKKTISLERQVRITAGSIVLIGSILSYFNPYFLVIPAFIGAGLTFAGITDTCGMGMMLAKMPWNQVNDNPSAAIQATAESCGS